MSGVELEDVVRNMEKYASNMSPQDQELARLFKAALKN